MKTVLGWLIHQGIAVALTYAGYVLGIEGAQNVAAFLVWCVCVPVGLIAVLSTEMQKRMANEPSTPGWQKAVSRTVALCMLGTFLWTGHWGVAMGWSIWLLCSIVARAVVESHRQASTA